MVGIREKRFIHHIAQVLSLSCIPFSCKAVEDIMPVDNPDDLIVLHDREPAYIMLHHNVSSGPDFIAWSGSHDRGRHEAVNCCRGFG